MTVKSLQKIDESTLTLPVTYRKASSNSNMFSNKEMRIFKFAARKKLGMLLLCFVSIAVMLWIFCLGKGEFGPNWNLGFINNSDVGFLPPESVDEKKTNHLLVNNETRITALTPVYFPWNPCNNFTFPPPPSDKKRIGPRPCPVCYLPVEKAIALMPKSPSYSPVVQNLTYIHEENSTRTEFGGSVFGGFPSLKQRLESYDVNESMAVHCGFVTGDKPGRNTGFDIDDSDLFEMGQCREVLVASAIFGAYDLIQQPKNMSEFSKKNVCFFMFVDEETENFLTSSNDNKRIGLWKIVVVHNLPYTDPRRNGKVPKLLLHRLFPNVRYSLWVDGKLELVVDPYQILERFLWRKNASFAISRHYRRFDVFVEADANKAAGKYDNASIDFQVDFYRKEGLTPYTQDKLPITSDVPEGCVVIREHIPISNLFTCLWFNEVDRFTSRDQLSFSTVRDKIMLKTNWSVDMFWDCERRNFVLQGYHRDILEHWSPPPPIVVSPPNIVLAATSPPSLPDIVVTKIRKVRRRRDRKSSRKQKVTTNGQSQSQSQN